MPVPANIFRVPRTGPSFFAQFQYDSRVFGHSLKKIRRR